MCRKKGGHLKRGDCSDPAFVRPFAACKSSQCGGQMLSVHGPPLLLLLLLLLQQLVCVWTQLWVYSSRNHLNIKHQLIAVPWCDASQHPLPQKNVPGLLSICVRGKWPTPIWNASYSGNFFHYAGLACCTELQTLSCGTLALLADLNLRPRKMVGEFSRVAYFLCFFQSSLCY